MFGNSLKGEDQLTNMLLPKLISLNSLNFDFMECSFSDKMMNCKDIIIYIYESFNDLFVAVSVNLTFVWMLSVYDLSIIHKDS